MRKEKLIAAIKTTIIDLVEGRKEYMWGKAESCNCGILASNIITADKKDSPLLQLWSRDAKKCQQTGVPVNRVYEELFNAGLTPQDIIELEYLANHEICKEAGQSAPSYHEALALYTSDGFTQKKELILYLQAWLRILEREGEEEKGVEEKVIEEKIIEKPQPLPSFLPLPLPAKEMEFVKVENMELKVYQN